MVAQRIECTLMALQDTGRADEREEGEEEELLLDETADPPPPPPPQDNASRYARRRV
jgi:hypothetical protein